jgi:electron transfer flavoprotein alpha subunit
MVDSRYGILDERKIIWVYLEQNDHAFEGVSLELLNKSRQIADQLGWKVGGLLIGYQVDKLVEQAFTYGADQVFLAKHPLLESFSIIPYTKVAYDAIMRWKPSVILFGATINGRDLAGRLAVRLRTGLNADCTDLYMDMEKVILVSEVSGFGGGVLALIEMADHRPQMATVRPGVFPRSDPIQGRSGDVVDLSPQLSEKMVPMEVVERAFGDQVDLTKAENLVIGGRGVSGNYDIIQKLATLLDADYGATRPPVDDGYIERERMVGQTGVICRPKVAFCCGISGAFHFIVGIQEAETVIAINSDPQAPIFEHADYCIVGDINQILPALIDELEKTSDPLPTSSRQVAHG